MNGNTYFHLSSLLLQPHFFTHPPSPPILITVFALPSSTAPGALSFWMLRREDMGGGTQGRRRRPRWDGQRRWPLTAAAIFVNAVATAAAAVATMMAVDRRDHTAG